MTKFLAKTLFTLILLFYAENSYALNNDQKQIYDGCFEDSQSNLGIERAKQYCKCTTIMITEKFSIEEILNHAQLSTEEQLNIYSFATSYCNQNANAK